MHKHGGDIYTHKDVIDFSTNINLLGMPEGVIKGANEGVLLSENYPDPECQDLKEKLAKHEAVSKDNLICGNGAADLIFSLVFSIKPKKALLLAPTFYEYEKALRASGSEIEYYYLDEENGFMLDEKFLEGLNENIDILFLCNPNNPTGELIKKELIEKILKKCEEKNIFLVIDECFMCFVDEAQEYSAKEFVNKSDNLFILKAFTKIYAMPGLRLGYGICSNKEVLDSMCEVSQAWSISIPAQRAGIYALDEKEYVNESLEILRQEKHYLKKELEKRGFKIYGSNANYIFFRVPESKKDIDFFAEFLGKGFLIRDCSNYEGLEKGYYRIAVKKHKENELFIKNISL